jgi:flagellar motor switch protein FliG
VSTALTERPAAEAPAAGAELTGPQKVAILYMALGPEKTAAISERLTPEEVETIGFEVARMGVVKGEIVDAVLQEWDFTVRAADSLAEGGIDLAREILERQFGPQRALQILKKITGQISDHAGLLRLRKADPQQLGNTLRNEHPQTVALVLAHLEQTQTALILKELTPEEGSRVVYRMASMEKVSPEMLQLIESVLGSEVEINLSAAATTSGGPAAVAGILNALSPSLEKEILELISRKDAALCDQIKALMFVFEDIATLEERAIQRLLREVDSKDLALALRAASDGLKNAIFSGLTQRALAAITEEMEMMGPVRMRDVEAAQAKIVAQVRRLEEQGEIVIASGADDVLVV